MEAPWRTLVKQLVSYISWCNFYSAARIVRVTGCKIALRMSVAEKLKKRIYSFIWTWSSGDGWVGACVCVCVYPLCYHFALFFSYSLYLSLWQHIFFNSNVIVGLIKYSVWFKFDRISTLFRISKVLTSNVFIVSFWFSSLIRNRRWLMMTSYTEMMNDHPETVLPVKKNKLNDTKHVILL